MLHLADRGSSPLQVLAIQDTPSWAGAPPRAADKAAAAVHGRGAPLTSHALAWCGASAAALKLNLLYYHPCGCEAGEV